MVAYRNNVALQDPCLVNETGRATVRHENLSSRFQVQFEIIDNQHDNRELNMDTIIGKSILNETYVRKNHNAVQQLKPSVC